MKILELEVSVTGKASSNIALYQKSVLDQIEQLKTKELITDEDFSSAEKVVKVCKEQEKNLVEAKANAQDKSATIKEVFAAIDNAQNIFRDTRLGLERQIKAEKANRKEAIVLCAIKEFKVFLRVVMEKFKFNNLDLNFRPETAFMEATKGKKNIDSMQAAVDKVMEDAKQNTNYVASIKFANLEIILDRDEQRLFPDAESLSSLQPDLLMIEIKKREEDNARKIEEIKREEAERVRREEQHKIIKEQEQKARDEKEQRANENHGDLKEQPAKLAPITEEEPAPPVKEPTFGPVPSLVKSFRIEVSGSWNFESTMDFAKEAAGDLRNKFGNSVTLTKV